MWFERVKKFFDKSNGTSSITDPVLIMWHHNDKLIAVMDVHVDNFLCAGTDLFYLKIIPKVTETFSVSREENCNFRYLGLNIQSEKIHISIDQNNYIEQLKKVNINPVRKFQKRKRNIKSINWSTSLDIKSHSTRYQFDVSILGSKLKDATTDELQTVNKLISKIKDNQYTLRYQILDLPFKIVLFTDAAFGI